MSELPLLRFKPILREALWGGRRLAELGKPLGSGEHYSESWEIVDHGADQSVVVGGPLDGATLHDLVTSYGASLLGRHQGWAQ
ncbi:MAG TPA: class I mannose-6-phosphate isomerase, partial [Lacipirellulaceae bacterium]|nr:class I mannose-6-phosphate isomerase [Lacipirellulaceae bacterium]